MHSVVLLASIVGLGHHKDIVQGFGLSSPRKIEERRSILKGIVGSSTLLLRPGESSAKNDERPDVLFPAQVFAGDWLLKRQIVSADVPLGMQVARTKADYFVQSAGVKEEIEYPVSFLDQGDGTAVLNHLKAWKAWSQNVPEKEPMSRAPSIKETRPNHNTISIVMTKNLESLQTNLVRRNFNLIDRNTFDAVEYAFVTYDRPKENFYLAQKIMTRWRWPKKSQALPPDSIDGTELVYFFQSASTFDEVMNWPLPNYPTPVLATKANIRLSPLP